MQIILIAGMPATGKTTLAKYLADRLDIPYISKDSIKEVLFDTVGAHCADRTAFGIASMDLMIHFADKIMQTNIPIILECNFESSTKDKLISLINKNNYIPITLLLQGDIDIIYKRFVERNDTKDRHKGHIHPISLDDFKQSVLDRGIYDFSIGERIVIDTTTFNTVSFDNIYHQLSRLQDTPTPQ